MDSADWLGLPQQRLLHFTAGRVFHDDDGGLTRIRQMLDWYPDDVWAWMMLSGWYLIGNAEPLRGRCLETNDAIGVSLLTAKLCRLIMQLAFLQERRYWPYDKWFGTAFQRLDASTALTALLEAALHSKDSESTKALGDALIWLGNRQNNLGLSQPVAPRRGPFEVGINDAVRPYEVINAGEYVTVLRQAITDPQLRTLIQVGAIDQLTHADDALIAHTDWPARLTSQYRDAIQGTPVP